MLAAFQNLRRLIGYHYGERGNRVAIDIEWSHHARAMLEERRIKQDWALQALQEPDRIQDQDDGNRAYIKAIPEHGGRYLRVVLNPRRSPNRAVTVFLDRRLGRKS